VLLSKRGGKFSNFARRVFLSANAGIGFGASFDSDHKHSAKTTR
jgi:hypothetical protein